MNTQVVVDSGIATQCTMAKQFPRDIRKSIKKAEDMALLTPEIAESCIYSLPRAGKTIQGPSVRLAEILASAWGNIFMAAEIKENNGRSVTARAYCYDVEENIRAQIEIKRSITSKDGRTYSYDMQTTTENAACSIALRNAIFKVVPRSYIDYMFEKCKSKLVEPISNQSKLESRLQTVFSKLEALGVPEKRIYEFYGKESVKDFNQNDYVDIIGVGTAIKEGHIKAEDAFKTADIEMLLPNINNGTDIASKLQNLQIN